MYFFLKRINYEYFSCTMLATFEKSSCDSRFEVNCTLRVFIISWMLRDTSPSTPALNLLLTNAILISYDENAFPFVSGDVAAQSVIASFFFGVRNSFLLKHNFF